MIGDQIKPHRIHQLMLVLFGVQAIGAISFALAVVVLVNNTVGTMPALATASLFTALFGWIGMQLTDLLVNEL